MPPNKKNRSATKARKNAQAAVAEIPPGEEMYYTREIPNPNTKISWPPSMAGKLDDAKFICVWPSNINSKRTLAKGRRVPISHSCEDPIVAEMSEVLQFYKLNHVIEPYKCYPRDWTYPGRVKVKLFDEDDQPCNEEVPSRRVLMMKMGELIPKLKIRNKRMEMAKRNEAMQQAQIQAASATSGSNKRKGKGRKGKR